MRISGGFARGRTIKVPKIADIRPTQEVVRQAVFSMLGERVEEATVLDLYAGSGAYGLEALSRGAAHATFVDTNRESIKAIETNLDVGRFWGKAEVQQVDAIRYVSEQVHEKFDLIFADPPYAYGVPKGLSFHLAEVIEDNGLIIFDHAKTVTLDKTEELEVVDSRSYGASAITILKKKP